MTTEPEPRPPSTTPTSPSPLSSGERRIDWAVRAAFVLVVVAALWPVLTALPLYSSRYDWRYFESMAEVARRSVVWFGQAPLWNPYSCGGEVDLANPQSMTAAPTFVFNLLFGTAVGFKLALVAYTLFALDGTYRLARHLGLSRAGSAVAAAAYGLSGYQAMHLSVGHINFAGVGLYPYLVLCFDRSLRRWEWVLPTGAVAAWIAVLGGTFTPAMAAELLVMWAAATVIAPLPAAPEAASPPPELTVRLGQTMLLLLVAGAVALLVGAVRMLPALEFITDHPRPLFRRTPDMSLLLRLFGDLWSWRELGPIPGRQYWSHEYTARLPLLIAPLLVGVAVFYRRLDARARALVLRLCGLGLFGALLALGNFSKVAPWTLLQKLPVLRDLRVPSRHLVLLTLWLALLGGLGAQALLDWLRAKLQAVRGERLARGLAVVLFLGCALDGAAFFAASFRGVFTVPLAAPQGPVPFFHVKGHWSSMRELIFQGHAVLGCDEEAPLQRAEALDEGEVPQARLLDPAAGTIVESETRVTPNVRVITVELGQPATLLLLNSNWNEHFRVEPPAARIAKVAGRLAVDLSGLGPGRHVVTVRYAPRSFYVGLAISAVSVPLFVLLFVWRRRRRG